jgi:N-acetylglutamate synthase-like GNAT family acetyltransferase
MLIRLAVNEDIPVLNEISWAAKASWGYSDELLELWRDLITLQPQNLQDYTVLVAENEGHILGFGAISFHENYTAEIEHLWVAPAHMRQGVGKELMSALLAEAKKKQITTIKILADPHAQPFYEKCGAKKIGDFPSTPTGRTIPILVITL